MALPFACMMLISCIAGLLSLCFQARRSLGAYRILRRPAFSSHLINDETGNLKYSLQHGGPEGQPSVHYFKFLITSPPFITNTTFRMFAMSVVGSPFTAT